MPERTKTKQVSDDYLKTLEEVKKQYQQYVEVSNLYKLLTYNEEETIQYQPPSPGHPLINQYIPRKVKWLLGVNC